MIPGVIFSTGVIAKAITAPRKMPNVMIMPINPPTYPLFSDSTVFGAFTAHSVDTYPLENANSTILSKMNQSDLNNHEGPT